MAAGFAEGWRAEESSLVTSLPEIYERIESLIGRNTAVIRPTTLGFCSLAATPTQHASVDSRPAISAADLGIHRYSRLRAI